MIKQVLAEYKERYLDKTDDLSALVKAAKRAHLGLSDKLISQLNNLAAELEGPIKVGVIGQFSSGKSTLLNLFLPKPILATGARPVSLIAVKIKYGEFRALAKQADEVNEISGVLNDQSKDSKTADELIIFSPNEHLKGLELIDTPGLNANHTDEATTKALWQSCDAFLWLSHASAASKASEAAALELLPEAKKYCLLTQFDLLDAQSAQLVLSYAKEFLAHKFEGISLFSSLKAINNEADSGMSELLGFLKGLNKDVKKQKIKRILKDSKNEIQNCKNSLSASLGILKELLENSQMQINVLNHSQNLNKLCASVLQAISQSAQKISSLIADKLCDKHSSYYSAEQKLFAKGLFSKHDYSYKSIKPNEVCLDIFYNDERFKKELLALKNKINKEFSLINENNAAVLSELKTLCERERTKLLGSKLSPCVNKVFYQNSFNFYEALNERVLAHLEKQLIQCRAQITLLSEQINIKALSNFEKATALTCAYLYEKINQAREYYEQNPKEFKLYVPSENEINQRLLGDLCFYEFDDILNNKKTLERIGANFMQNYQSQKEQIIAQIDAECERLDNINAEIAELFACEF